MAIARVTQSFVVAGTLQNGSVRVTQSIVIAAVGLGISCGSPINGTIGIGYLHTFPSGGGVAPLVFSVTVGSLPAGLTLDTPTGILSGTPTQPGQFSFTIQVMDANGQVASAACSILISGKSTPSNGGAHRKCLVGEILPSRIDALDLVGFQRILENVKPQNVEEVR
jgi:hypothetical protein